MGSVRPAVPLALVALAIGAASASAATNVISTVAGNGTAGPAGDNGPATAAQLAIPVGVTPIPGGGYYIADQSNSKIRKVAADGTITTVAGTGTPGPGGDGGPALQAEFNAPSDVAIMPDGSLLVADANNNRIRRIGTDGIITTVAGTGTPGSAGDNGPATAAQLSFPAGLDVAADGTFFIADNDSHKIRAVGPDGVIRTYAGNGTPGGGGDGGFATLANLAGPADVELTADGGFLISELDGHRVRKVGPDNKISLAAGTGTGGFSGDPGQAKSAQIKAPLQLAAAADGSFLIADSGNNRIRRVAGDGVITTVAGNGTAGGLGDGSPATAAELNRPFGIAIDAGNDYLIADTFNHRVRKVDAGDPPPVDEPPEEPPPPPPPPPQQHVGPTARVAASPNPSCTGVPTKLDGSASTPGSSPIVSYRFYHFQREASSKIDTPFNYERTLYEGSASVHNTVFTWNYFATVRWFESYPGRDPVYLILKVTDANGLTDEADTTINFVQKNSNESRAGCPSNTVNEVLRAFILPGKTFDSLAVEKKAYAVKIPCNSYYWCIGTVTAVTKTLRVRTSAKFKPVRVLGGPVSVPPKSRRKARGRLTRRGYRLLRKNRKLPVRVTVRLYSPTGKLVKTVGDTTLKLPRR